MVFAKCCTRCTLLWRGIHLRCPPADPLTLLLINTAPSDHVYSWTSLQCQPFSRLVPFSALLLAGTGLAQSCPLPSLTHFKSDTKRTSQHGLWLRVCHIVYYFHTRPYGQSSLYYSTWGIIHQHHAHRKMTSTLKQMRDIYDLFKRLPV